MSLKIIGGIINVKNGTHSLKGRVLNTLEWKITQALKETLGDCCCTRLQVQMHIALGVLLYCRPLNYETSLNLWYSVVALSRVLSDSQNSLVRISTLPRPTDLFTALLDFAVRFASIKIVTNMKILKRDKTKKNRTINIDAFLAGIIFA